eukprot:1691868-Amphidinium_carterae.1
MQGIVFAPSPVNCFALFSRCARRRKEDSSPHRQACLPITATGLQHLDAGIWLKGVGCTNMLWSKQCDARTGAGSVPSDTSQTRILVPFCKSQVR